MESQRYDVAVIGSGIGGLGAAVLLAMGGYRVLVAEKLDKLGGRLSTVDIEGFKCPTGAVHIHGSGWIPRIMKEAGVKAELRQVSRAFYRIEGRDYELPSKGRLAMLLDLLEKTEVNRAALVGHIAKEVASKKVMSGLKQAIGMAEKKVEILTFRDWLLQYTDNELAHEIFDQLCANFLMAHSWELPAREFFLFVSKMGGMRDILIAPNGNLDIMEQLAEVVKANGNVWTNCLAKRIVVTKGTATGVVVEKEGHEVEISCSAVINNACPSKNVELAGKENFDEAYLRDLRVKIRPSPSVYILVASDKPLILDGKPGLLNILGGRRVGGLSPITSFCPELAPPGQHLLYICAEPRSKLLPMDEEYECQQCMLDIREMFPDFEKHGRILLMKPLNVDNEFVEGGTWCGYGMPVITPVRNLFNVGDRVMEPGLNGTSGAAESGVRVANLIKRQVKPR